MPANLPPEYHEAREDFENANTVEEKLAALNEMLAVIPKHKGTDKMRADLRKRVSQLKEEGEKEKAVGPQEDPYVVEKHGAGQVLLLGFPNAGKSSLIKTLTRAKVKVAEYPFTTNLPQPGMMPYEDIKIQLVDSPPITEDGISGPFTVTIRNSDLLLVVIDLSSDRCLDHLQFILEILEEKRILRDEVPEGVQAFNREQCLVVGTKSDLPESSENLEVIYDLLPDAPEILPVSVEDGKNLEELKRNIFDALNVIRIYSKAPGEDPDLERPFIMPKGSEVSEFASEIHKDIASRLKKARVWGSVRFDGQSVSHDYMLSDKDIVELNT